MFAEVLALAPDVECACHFHDTYGLALANCYAALAAGVTSFESSVAGLGGCPFTAVAGGNTCTEDLVHALQRGGMRRDVDLAALVALAREVAAHFGREMPGKVYRTGPIPEPAAATR
jgi:hydroxymethylglutaryl-CoA lyase